MVVTREREWEPQTWRLDWCCHRNHDKETPLWYSWSLGDTNIWGPFKL